MNKPPANQVLHIKKYPNRRYYDSTRKKHVTLDDLYRDVLGGAEIVVVDSDGNDISNIVLTQIILEHDPPKLSLFPSSLLHQTIQANQQMFARFVDDYFAQAMDAFVSSRQQFDEFLARAGLSPLQPATPFDWAQRFLKRLTGSSGQAPKPVQSPDDEPPQASKTTDMEEPSIDALRTEMDELRAELALMRKQTVRESHKASAAKRGAKKKAKK